jgi:hypothetical protein
VVKPVTKKALPERGSVERDMGEKTVSRCGERGHSGSLFLPSRNAGILRDGRSTGVY